MPVYFRNQSISKACSETYIEKIWSLDCAFINFWVIIRLLGPGIIRQYFGFKNKDKKIQKRLGWDKSILFLSQHMVFFFG